MRGNLLKSVYTWGAHYANSQINIINLYIEELRCTPGGGYSYTDTGSVYFVHPLEQYQYTKIPNDFIVVKSIDNSFVICNI